MKNNIKGIAAIEIMVIVVILLALTTIAIPLFINLGSVDRENITYQKIQKIKKAIIGDYNKLVNKERTDFGFVGDIGSLPNNLQELVVNSSYPNYHKENNVWFGWRGPYLKSSFESGKYVALVDAWGNDIAYNNSSLPAVKEIRSAGIDGTFNTSDDIFDYILLDDINAYVEGDFLTRVTKTLINSYSGTLRIYYPNGGSTIAHSDIVINSGEYDSQLTNIRIPIGNRFFTTLDSQYLKLVAINGGGKSVVNFYGEESPTDITYERSFDSHDDTVNNPYTVLRGSWQEDNGNLYADSAGEHRLVFGYPTWRDYRVEADATLYSGRGYGIYYRTDGNTDITGYIFQYDPGLYPSGIEFVIRKVYQGNENYFPYPDRFLARVRLTSAEFQSIFNSNIYNDSHHISITVIGDRHIVKVDGQVVIDVHDNEPLFPCGGLCGEPGLRSWDGNRYTAFHDIKVYQIPPMPDNEIVWWQFEEGNRDIVYGSGFLVDGVEHNGIIYNASRVSQGIYGSAVQLQDQLNYIAVNDHDDLDLSDQGTISLWINMNSRKSWAGLVHKGNKSDWSDEAYSFQFYGRDRLELLLTDTSNRTYTLLSNTRFKNSNLGKWYHLAASWGPNGMKLYINGVLDSSNNEIVNVRNTNGNLIIGAQLSETYSSSYKNLPLVGIIDEVHIFAKQLSDSKIRSLYLKYSGNM